MLRSTSGVTKTLVQSAMQLDQRHGNALDVARHSIVAGEFSTALDKIRDAVATIESQDFDSETRALIDQLIEAQSRARLESAKAMAKSTAAA